MQIVPRLLLEGRTLLSRPHNRRSMKHLVSGLADEYERVYLADEDGVTKNKPQLDLAQVVCDELPTIYEGGIRAGPNIIDILMTGAESAVIGTATVISLDDLRGAFKLSENITFKVDYRDGISGFDPQIAGRALIDLARDVKEIGIDQMLVPIELAEEGARAKRELGFTLGVFAPMSQRERIEALGADYLVTDEVRGLDGDE